MANPVSRFGRYLTMADMEKDTNELADGWVIAEWNVVSEEFREDSYGGVVKWLVPVFYARFVEVPVVAPERPAGMRAR